MNHIVCRHDLLRSVRRHLRVRSAGLLASLCAAIILLAPTAPVRATVMVKHSLKEVAEHAEAVFLGQVTQVKSEVDKASGWVWSLYTFSVERVLAGEIAEKSTSLRCLGGTADGRAMRTDGMPLLSQGERVLVFADVDESPLCQFAGWELGVFRFRTVAGEDVLTDSTGDAVVSLGADNPTLARVALDALPASGQITAPSTAVSGTPDPNRGAPATKAPVDAQAVIEEFGNFVSAHAIRATTLKPTVEVIGPPMQRATRR